MKKMLIQDELTEEDLGNICFCIIFSNISFSFVPNIFTKGIK